MISLRQDVIDFVVRRFQTDFENPWMRDPMSGGFRHADNQKWFALINRVPARRLGGDAQGEVDVVSFKVGDLLLRDVLLNQAGFYPGLTPARGNWVSARLDGAVTLDSLRPLIEDSYLLTASTATKKALRPPKEWVIPSNLRYYDSVHAFDGVSEIDWKQGRGIKVDDVVYLYVGAPVSAILFKCVVTQTDMPWFYCEDGLEIHHLMKIRFLRRYDPSRFTFDVLKRDYGVFAVRGPRGLPESLSRDLNDPNI